VIRKTLGYVVSTTIILTVMGAKSAIAGPYADELSKCLVQSTSPADKSTLVKFIFGVMSLHPEVKPVTVMSDTQRTELNKNAAGLFEKLLTETCRTQTQEAVKYEGQSVLQGSFKLLGEVATRDLMTHPNVEKGLSEFAGFINPQKMLELFSGAK
jgi:hypothetical protein